MNKKKTGVLAFSMLFALMLDAQIKDKASAGFQLNQHGRDFGLGLQLSSPLFAWDVMAVRLRMDHKWAQTYKEETSSGTLKEDWQPYFLGELGLVSFGGKFGYSRFYSEGGVLGAFGISEISDEKFVIGGYGLFGFEFFLSRRESERLSFFMEMGAGGLGLEFDSGPVRSVHGNGFFLQTGMRIYLGKQGGQLGQ